MMRIYPLLLPMLSSLCPYGQHARERARGRNSQNENRRNQVWHHRRLLHSPLDGECEQTDTHKTHHHRERVHRCEVCVFPGSAS